MPAIIWSRRLAGTPNKSLGRFFTLPSGPIFLTSVTNRSLETYILYLVFKYCHIERYSKSFADPVISFRMQKQLSAVFCKKRCSYKFQNIYGKHLCQSLFLNKVAGLRLATLLKKKLCHRCFPVNFPKFLRTPFLTEHLRWLLLENLKASYYCDLYSIKLNWHLHYSLRLFFN